MKRFLSVTVLGLVAASFLACTKKEEAPAPNTQQAVQAPSAVEAAPGTEQAPAAPAPEQPGS